MNALRQPAAGLLLGLLLAIAFYSYMPGAAGPFIVDDIPNILENDFLVLPELSLESLREAALSSPASRFRRPLAMLSLALDFTLAGGKSELAAKTVNILLHLICGLGVYLLTVKLLTRFHNRTLVPDINTQIRGAALLVAGMFLLHPLYVSTVLYAIQRMAILSNLFIIYGCLGYIYLRDRTLRLGAGLPGLIASGVLFTVLGFFSKENGALLPGFLLLIELFCFNFRFHPEAHPRSGLILGTFLGIPVAAIGGYLVFMYLSHAGEPLAPYGFTPWERLLTEARVLWSYAGWLTFLNPSPMGIYHDDLTISTGLAQPWTTMPAAMGWLIVVVLTARLSLRRHVIAFGLLWFLWGHILESTVLPLAPMFEHRNYQPGLGVFLIFVLLFRSAADTLVQKQTLRHALWITIFVILPLYILQARVDDWADNKSLTLALLRDKPDSAQSLIMAAKFLAEGMDPENAMLAVRQAQLLDPGEPSHIMAEAIIHCGSYPTKKFDSGLERNLRDLRVAEFVSVNTLRQLRQLIPNCQSSQANTDALLTLYSNMSNHTHDRLAMLGWYGRGAIHMQQGKYTAVVKEWEAAMARHPDAEGLKPALEWARRQINQGEDHPPSR